MSDDLSNTDPKKETQDDNNTSDQAFAPEPAASPEAEKTSSLEDDAFADLAAAPIYPDEEEDDAAQGAAAQDYIDPFRQQDDIDEGFPDATKAAVPPSLNDLDRLDDAGDMTDTQKPQEVRAEEGDDWLADDPYPELGEDPYPDLDEANNEDEYDPDNLRAKLHTRMDDPVPDDDDQIIIFDPNERYSVKRGEEVDLSVRDPTLKQMLIGIGWDVRSFEGEVVDLDASIFVLDKDDKTRNDQDFIFYNSMEGAEGSVKHLGDSRSGAGDGDDENMLVDLNALPYDVMKVVFVISIYPKDDLEEETFDLVRNVLFRIANNDSKHEIFCYELDEELDGGRAIVVGQIERIGAKWIFRAIGETVESGLGEIATEYGIIVAEKVSS